MTIRETPGESLLKNHRGRPSATLTTVHRLMGEGLGAAEIAERLNIAERTAIQYMSKVRSATGVARKVSPRVKGNATIEQRFAAKVNRDGPVPAHVPHLGPCHVWTAALDHGGYGMFNDTKGELGVALKRWSAHRVAYMLKHQVSLDPSIIVMHECDNPACVNPDHLRAGTQLENMQATYTRGRNRGRGVLNEALAREIKQRAANGERPFLIAKSLGISDANVRGVLMGRTWRHVA